jgi:hypothetical protein
VRINNDLTEHDGGIGLTEEESEIFDRLFYKLHSDGYRMEPEELLLIGKYHDCMKARDSTR